MYNIRRKHYHVVKVFKGQTIKLSTKLTIQTLEEFLVRSYYACRIFLYVKCPQTTSKSEKNKYLSITKSKIYWQETEVVILYISQYMPGVVSASPLRNQRSFYRKLDVCMCMYMSVIVYEYVFMCVQKLLKLFVALSR